VAAAPGAVFVAVALVMAGTVADLSLRGGIAVPAR
jgi:hypothetical protein